MYLSSPLPTTLHCKKSSTAKPTHPPPHHFATPSKQTPPIPDLHEQAHRHLMRPDVTINFQPFGKNRGGGRGAGAINRCHLFPGRPRSLSHITCIAWHEP